MDEYFSHRRRVDNVKSIVALISQLKTKKNFKLKFRKIKTKL